MTMPPELKHGFDNIEGQRDALQSTALALSDAQLNCSPGAQTWSARQIVEHLVLTDETLGQAYPPGTVPAEAFMFRAVPRPLRYALILRALRQDKVLPLPSTDINPQSSTPLPELLTRWEASRRQMSLALSEMQPDDKRYAHPVLGPISASQMLELGQTHTAYHMRQIEALQRDSAFPRSER